VYNISFQNIIIRGQAFNDNITVFSGSPSLVFSSPQGYTLSKLFHRIFTTRTKGVVYFVWTRYTYKQILYTSTFDLSVWPADLYRVEVGSVINMVVSVMDGQQFRPNRGDPAAQFTARY
jgi:hypothetical protein